MSNSFNDLVSSALLETLDFMGEIIIIGSTSVLAIVNHITLDEELLAGGLLQNRGITAVIATPLTLPAVGSTLLYQGLRYRIEDVRQDTVGVELVCSTDSK